MRYGVVSSLQLFTTKRWDAGYNLDVKAAMGDKSDTVENVQAAMGVLKQRADDAVAEAGRLRKEAAALTERARIIEASVHHRGSRR